MTDFSPATRHIVIYTGGTYELEYQFLQDAVEVDLTGCTVDGELYNVLGAALPLSFDVTYVSRPTGEVLLSLDENAIDTLKSPGGYYAVKLTLADQTSKYYLRGRYLLKDVASGIAFEDIAGGIQEAIEAHEQLLTAHPQYVITDAVLANLLEVAETINNTVDTAEGFKDSAEAAATAAAASAVTAQSYVGPTAASAASASAAANTAITNRNLAESAKTAAELAAVAAADSAADIEAQASAIVAGASAAADASAASALASANASLASAELSEDYKIEAAGSRDQAAAQAVAAAGSAAAALASENAAAGSAAAALANKNATDLNVTTSATNATNSEIASRVSYLYMASLFV